VAVATLPELVADASRTAIVSGVSKDPNGKVTLLLVPRGERNASVVAKVATTPASERALEAEARVLAGLDRMRLGPLAGSVPEVLGWSRYGDRRALLLTGLRGTTMLSRYHGWRHTSSLHKVAADFAAVARWLEGFQSATSGGLRALLDGELRGRLAARFDGDHLVEDALRSLDAIERPLEAIRVRESAVHGDLWMGNLLVADGAVSGVVDWEAGDLRGAPVRDAVRFVLTYALYLDRHTGAGAKVAGHPGLVAGRWGAGIRHAMSRGAWFGEIAERFLRASLRRAAVDPDLWKTAMLGGLADVAATADEPGFARSHLDLFVELTQVAS
jgi:aminoglycoside phosphotransferase